MIADIVAIVWNLVLLAIYLSVGAALVVALMATGAWIFLVLFIVASVITWLLVR